jgi:hypothetical protein
VGSAGGGSAGFGSMSRRIGSRLRAARGLRPNGVSLVGRAPDRALRRECGRRRSAARWRRRWLWRLRLRRAECDTRDGGVPFGFPRTVALAEHEGP